MPKSVVINPFFDWGVDRPPRNPYNETVIYEAHVKGLTQLHPDIPEELRGTYAGIAHPVIIEHLKKLGVTAIELMPVHQFVHDTTLVDKGLSNYWGYNTIGFFAPHNAYAASGRPGQQVQEFKAMVRALHEAGIEVILDVVYNHTAEGNHLGPTLSFRGIDNAAYYRLVEDDQQHYMDYTGTGNTLNVRHPHALQLIMDSLRYWVTEMHVDGFRFDLAATLAREFYDVDRLSTFFELVQQDPVVSQVKLIAEPWDVGPGGYQVGNFPPQWTEWNGKYRDTVRDFWRGEPHDARRVRVPAHRLGRPLRARRAAARSPAINFVTAHDGFTLRDLVSYNEKHNEANGEDNNDGESHNRSWNCGVEGPTDDPAILALRARQQRNFLATLLLSQGVPMICHGDELGRTQQGNNNGYCQDNELTWVDWANIDVDLLAFTRRLTELRRAHPIFRRRRFFDGRPVRRRGQDTLPDIAWFTPDGAEMTEEDWDSGFGRAIAVYLNGQGIAGTDGRGAARRRRLVPAVLQRPRRADRLQPAGRRVRAGLGGRDRHLASTVAGPPARQDRGGRRARSASGPRALVVLRPGRLGMAARRPTYRLQVRPPEFDLHAAADACDYLATLGAGAVYLSPLLPSVPRLGARLRRRRLRHDRRRARRRRRLDAAARRAPAPAGSRSSSTSCRTTPASPTRRRTRPGGTCCASAGSRRTRRGSTSTGRAAGCCCRCSATHSTRPSSRSTTASCATTSTASRSRRAPAAPARPRPRCTTGSTTSWSTTGAPTPSRTTAGSSPSPRSPDCGSRTPPCSTRPTTRSDPRWVARSDRRPAGRPPRRPGPTRPATSSGCAAGRRRRLDHGREDPRAGRGAAGRLAGRRHHRLRRAAEVGGLFVDPAAEAAFDGLYRELTGDQASFAEHVARGKRLAVSTILQAEVSRPGPPGARYRPRRGGAGRAAGRVPRLPLLPAGGRAAPCDGDRAGP